MEVSVQEKASSGYLWNEGSSQAISSSLVTNFVIFIYGLPILLYDVIVTFIKDRKNTCALQRCYIV